MQLQVEGEMLTVTTVSTRGLRALNPRKLPLIGLIEWVLFTC